MAMTSTMTANQFSTVSEKAAVGQILRKCQVSGLNVSSDKLFEQITDLAGTARTRLLTKAENNIKDDGELFDNSEMILYELGIPVDYRNNFKSWLDGLAYIMIGPSPEKEQAPKPIFDHIRQVVDYIKKTPEDAYKKFNRLGTILTQEDAFKLGVALYVCGGDLSEMEKWRQREQMTPDDLLTQRGITEKEMQGIVRYYDNEICQRVGLKEK